MSPTSPIRTGTHEVSVTSRLKKKKKKDLAGHLSSCLGNIFIILKTITYVYPFHSCSLLSLGDFPLLFCCHPLFGWNKLIQQNNHPTLGFFRGIPHFRQ